VTAQAGRGKMLKNACTKWRSTADAAMPSPLEHLYPHIIPALARVAPERARELQGLIDQLGVTFVFDDKSPKMVFKSDHANIQRQDRPARAGTALGPRLRLHPPVRAHHEAAAGRRHGEGFRPHERRQPRQR